MVVPRRSEEFKIIAAIRERQVIEKVLTTWGWICSRRPGAERARRGTTSPPEPRRPSQTSRFRLQHKTEAEAASRDVSARRHRNQGKR